MKSDIRAISLVTMGIVCGLVWGAGCHRNSGSAGAVPQATTSGAILVGSEPNMTTGADIFVLMGNPLPEDRATLIAPRDGNLTNLFIRPNSAPDAASSVTVSLRINGVDSALAVTHTGASGTAPAGNTATSVPVVQGDRIVFHFVQGGTQVTACNFSATAEYQ